MRKLMSFIAAYFASLLSFLGGIVYFSPVIQFSGKWILLPLGIVAAIIVAWMMSIFLTAGITLALLGPIKDWVESKNLSFEIIFLGVFAGAFTVWILMIVIGVKYGISLI